MVENNIKLEEGWLHHLAAEFKKPYMEALKNALKLEYDQHQVYPPKNLIFNAFNSTPFETVKVIILGQDPYHGKGQAHGLSFSVPPNMPLPPSLKNIYKEIRNTYDCDLPTKGDLTSWAEQGVLLLNSFLTVREGEAFSHAKIGWEEFTDRAIEILAENREYLVFMLWGAKARAKKKLINPDQHLILESVHPSPLSAHNGFFGNHHFKKANDYLKAYQKEEIDWIIK